MLEQRVDLLLGGINHNRIAVAQEGDGAANLP
jgi:hypothetical protein